METQKILIALGSPSDKDKIISSFHHFNLSKKYPVDYYLSVASAHRTPELVESHALEHSWDAIIAGAGLSNVLASEYLKYADLTTVIVGLPISDTKSKGLTSFLSTSELPSGYPVATVGIDRIDSALHLANYLVQNRFNSISLIYAAENQTLEKAIRTLDELGVKYSTQIRNRAICGHDIPKNELPLYIISPEVVKRCQSFGSAVESYIACFDLGMEPFLEDYLSYSRENGHLAFINSGENLAVYGAKVLARNDRGLKDRIESYLEKGKGKYSEYENLISLS